MQSGRVSMERRRCEAQDLLMRTVEVMRPMADEARVEVVVDAARGALWADADRVMQTLTNLLSNAIKFSPPGAIVRMSSSRRDDEVLFEVHDQGRGIPADKLGAIFERFQQVDASDARQKGGTGLGLAICRSIVDQHGGRIWVDSEVGRGRTFSFTLPALAEPETALAETTEGGGPTVLVCDDDASILEVVGAILREQGYGVILASSGEEAARRAASEQPDVILLDLLMPGMDGWDTAAALRRQASTAAIPIVILSVLGEGEARPVEGDVVEWLNKPLHEASLFEALDKALDRRRHASRVLLVEDDLDLARVLTAGFERRGLETFHAEDGERAAELSRRVLPDLVVLDLNLPGCDGFAVVDSLRSDDRLHAVPLVVYTAKDLDEGDRERLTLDGSTEFLTKGRVSPEEFEERVLALLTRIVPNPKENQDVEAHLARR